MYQIIQVSSTTTKFMKKYFQSLVTGIIQKYTRIFFLLNFQKDA